VKKRTFFLAAAAVMALAVAASLGSIQLFDLNENANAKRFHTAWKDTYAAPGPMVRGVDAVVMARFVGTSPGRVAFSDNPEDAVPFELNHFVVEQGMKGVRSGAAITVERVGGVANGESIVLDADGGPYVAGEQYVLFLNKQPESNFYYVVNDQARFSVDREQRLVPVSDGAVATALRGSSVRELGARVRSEMTAARQAM
jgi:hypothetical protein